MIDCDYSHTQPIDLLSMLLLNKPQPQEPKQNLELTQIDHKSSTKDLI